MDKLKQKQLHEFEIRLAAELKEERLQLDTLKKKELEALQEKLRSHHNQERKKLTLV